MRRKGDGVGEVRREEVRRELRGGKKEETWTAR